MPNIYSSQNNQDANTPVSALKTSRRADYRKYEDPSGDFSSKELNYAVWYVRHKVLLYDLLLGGLIVFSIVTWVFSLARWGYYFAAGRSADTKLASQLAVPQNYTPFHSRIDASPIVIRSTVILPSGIQKYSVVAEAYNPNAAYIVYFKYFFVVDGVKGPEQEEFLLANETKPLAYLGLDSEGAPATAVVGMSDVRWQRISAHDIQNVQAWQNERLAFKVANFVFTPANGLDGLASNRVTFDLYNSTPYGYKQPSFYAVLYVGESMVNVLPFTVNSFPSLTTTTVDVRNFVTNLSATDVRVFPRINLFDPNVYLPPPH